MKLTDVVILDGARTAIGSFGGSLSALTPAELGTCAAKEAVSRSGVAADDIDHAVFGHIIITGPQDAYVARHIALNTGMPASSAAFNVNRLCGSAVQSVVSAAQMIVMGDSRIALAGGTESMSQGAYLLPNVRKGLRMGDGRAVDMTVGILSDPFGSGHMGLTAERIAQQYDLSREDLDAFSAESHRRAARAIENGYFAGQIVPVTVKQGRKEILFAQDEHVRAGTTVESLAGLKPAFRQDGIVTPGNASGINDGAAAMVLTSAAEAAKRGLKARARLVGYAFSGVNPEVMGLGPIPAVRQVLQQTGLAVADLDVIESNEAFAAQALAVSRELGLPDDKVNPNGGAVALGHPVGATGSILIIKTLAELERTGGQYGLITMCIGGGQGIALIIERLG
ncbi:MULTISPECIES: beta-ketothiolase BktB [Marinobacter]|uniref:Acetyl-CoA C-acyltransferase n=1 Tax=Marinobacter profundi TaxID=2666256 RepID=A0A2G1UGR1_9GAMM|nr:MULTISPECIES: beta-ketothiolase BktB [Marinobacter]MBD3655898.1 beta-ketothiolase BktB [Marinobacter sp.]PHQ13610.1 acetyl-CoA C-acyltransferase [Marinobacter profundi]